jgi:peroxiredoxin
MSVKRMIAGFALGWTLAAGAGAATFEARSPAAAPALQAHDVAGTPRTLADYRGKAVLLNFWASWCPPCLQEMPSMERLRVKMAGRPLAIVAISSAEPAADVTGYLSRMSLGFDILLDSDGTNTRRWKVFAMPTTFLIDAEGQLRQVITGAIDWDTGDGLEAVEALLAKPR